MSKIEVSTELLSDLQWMARRYADGRSSYVTSLLNEHTKILLKLDVPLNGSDSSVFAYDRMGKDFDGLTDRRESFKKLKKDRESIRTALQYRSELHRRDGTDIGSRAANILYHGYGLLYGREDFDEVLSKADRETLDSFLYLCKGIEEYMQKHPLYF